MDGHVAKPELEVDQDHIVAFFETIYVHADPGSFVALRTLDDTKEAPAAILATSLRVDDPQLPSAMAIHAKNAARHPFPAVFAPIPATFKNRKKADTGYLANGLVLSADCDAHPNKAANTLACLLGVPTLTVESGSSWTNPETGEVEAKKHLYWRLREPTRTTQEHAQLAEARKLAAKLVGGDLASAPIVHPMRCPGSWHRKVQPRLCRILKRTDTELDLSQALELLRGASGEIPNGASSTHPFEQFGAHAGNERTADLADIAAALDVIPNSEDVGWEEWNRVAMATFAASEGEGFAAFDAWSRKWPGYDANNTAAKWEKLRGSPPTSIGAGTLFHLAREAVPGWQKPSSITAEAANPENNKTGDSPAGLLLLVWHGDVPPEPPPQLVEGLLPQVGVAFAAGQAGFAKTFAMVDLALSVIFGRDFAGRQIRRSGGVLWLAAEGESEIDARVRGAVLGKLEPECHDKRLPFAHQFGTVPSLTAKDALPKLLQLARAAEDGLKANHGLALALTIIDTLGAAAGFDDENSASETQRVMNTLRALSKETGALALAIDHYGKIVDTGIRGSSAKLAAADAVLAFLGDKDNEGNIANRRMAIVKVRSAASGLVIPFALRVVQLDNFGDTTCVVDWQSPREPEQPKAGARPLWTGKARILRYAIEAAIAEHGKPIRPFGVDGAEQIAVERKFARAEFDASYSTDEDAKPDTKRRTFSRLVDEAQAKRLIAARELSSVDWIWFVKNEGP